MDVCYILTIDAARFRSAATKELQSSSQYNRDHFCERNALMLY